MNHCLIVFLLFLSAGASPLAAANVAPVVKTQIADQTFYAGATAKIDLTNAFSDPDTNAVRFSTVLGDFDVQLFTGQKPITVTNFLKYVDQGRYFKIDPTTHHRASSFVHRSIADFVIQGGGFIGTVSTSDPTVAVPTQVAAFPAIQNEPGISNKRGTIAMAKLPNNANSATSQWFVNLKDNGGAPSNLDTMNGGFTVFGKVIGNGMTTVDKIAMVPRFNFGSPFDTIPLRDYMDPNPIRVPNLVSIPDIIQIPPFVFTVTSANPAIATVSVSAGRRLAITAKQTGTTTISVKATDFDGAFKTQHFDVTVVPSPGRLVNISTRLQVQADPNELIAGFIVAGTSPKRVLIRAIGPSLSQAGIANPLNDPILQLRDQTKILANSDDWGDGANRQQIKDTDAPPTSSSEAAIVATLPANNASYSAIIRGINGTGVGLAEIYDLDRGPGSRLANISSRGFVQTGDNVMIGGFIIGGQHSAKVVVRGIGPSLSSAGITNPLRDPVLELRNGQGTKIAQNNDWQMAANASDIQATGIAPTNPHESAILTTQAPGNYTAILSGAGTTPTGVALVEVYHLQ